MSCSIRRTTSRASSRAPSTTGTFRSTSRGPTLLEVLPFITHFITNFSSLPYFTILDLESSVHSPEPHRSPSLNMKMHIPKPQFHNPCSSDFRISVLLFQSASSFPISNRTATGSLAAVEQQQGPSIRDFLKRSKRILLNKYS